MAGKEAKIQSSINPIIHPRADGGYSDQSQSPSRLPYFGNLRGGNCPARHRGKGSFHLYNAHIDEYAHGNLQNHQPKALRKLLLHKSEIRKLFELASVKGNALLPLSFYWKNGKVKVALGVGKGKAQFDKREDLKNREAERELKRATMRRVKS